MSDNNHKKNMQSLVESFFFDDDVYTCDNNGRNILTSIVITYDYKNIKDILLYNKLDVNICDNNGDTALCLAIKNFDSNNSNDLNNDNFKIIQLLLQNDANPNKKSNNIEPIVYAFNKNNIEIMRLLLEYDANPNIRINGRHMICVAVKNNNENVVDLLLDYGISFNICDNKILGESIYESGHSILNTAVRNNNTKIIKSILEHNDNIKIIDLKYNELSNCNCLGCNYNNCDDLLMIASKNNNLDITKLLLKYGYNYSMKNIKKLSPIHMNYVNKYAITKNEINKYVQINHTNNKNHINCINLMEKSKIFKLLYQISLCKDKCITKDVIRYIAKSLFL